MTTFGYLIDNHLKNAGTPMPYTYIVLIINQMESKDLTKMQESILENKKRTYQMFLGQVEDKVPEVEEVVRLKLELKIKTQYSEIGVVPGILVEDNKRRKLLMELGVPLRTKQIQ